MSESSGVNSPAICFREIVYGLGDLRIRQVDTAYLKAYFDELGRCDSVPAWQFQQAVSAIEMLFKMLGTNEVAETFNWTE